MDEQLADAARHVFGYPSSAIVRKHGPRGYGDYKSYKPWLRDQFQFRCVYCLCREHWEPNGHHVFAVEHHLPRSTHPHLVGDYDNLLYACLTCNALRQDRPLPLDLFVAGANKHLRVVADGSVEVLTPEGSELRDIVQLNRPSLVQFRQRILSMIDLLTERATSSDERVLTNFLSYPTDLPNLAKLRPPQGNTRSNGITQSWFERSARNELPVVY